MEDIGTYYIRMLTNIALYNGQTIGLSIIHSFLSYLTMIYLFILAVLILRARPSAPENRFMSLMLVTEGFKVMANWYNIYPFGPEIMPVIMYCRVAWYFFVILSLLMYFSTSSFYPVKYLGFMNKNIIRNNLFWVLPLLSVLIIGSMIYSAGGMVEAFGGLVFLSEKEYGIPGELTLYPGSDPLVTGIGLQDKGYRPFQFFVPQQTGVARLLLLAPVFFALIAMAFMRNAQRRLERSGGKNEKAVEARSLFIGFSGKVVFQGSMTAFIIYNTIKFGQFNTADIAGPFGDERSTIVQLMIGLYGFLFSILAGALFEGVMFTYAILKNEILGIDERLRKGFSTAVFASFGGILLLAASELMESMIGFGWIGGVFIGLPLIVLRKPILSMINRFSNIIMPESFTSAEKNYLEGYSVAMEDGIITSQGRRMLEIQAKTLDLNSSRIQHLESWFDSNRESNEEE